MSVIFKALNRTSEARGESIVGYSLADASLPKPRRQTAYFKFALMMAGIGLISWASWRLILLWPQAPSAAQASAYQAVYIPAEPVTTPSKFAIPAPRQTTPAKARRAASMQKGAGKPESAHLALNRAPIVPNKDAAPLSQPAVLSPALSAPELLTRLDKAIEAQADPAEIEALFDKLAGLKGEKDLYALRLKSYWLLTRGENQAAQSVLERVLAISPMDLEAGLNMALCEVRLGQAAAAKARMERLKQFYPESESVQRMWEAVIR